MITKRQLYEENNQTRAMLYELRANVESLTTYPDKQYSYGISSPQISNPQNPYLGLGSLVGYPCYNYFTYKPPTRLNATEIIQRFEELYEYLGLERVQETAKTHLVKKKKQSE